MGRLAVTLFALLLFFDLYFLMLSVSYPYVGKTPALSAVYNFLNTHWYILLILFIGLFPLLRWFYVSLRSTIVDLLIETELERMGSKVRALYLLSFAFLISTVLDWYLLIVNYPPFTRSCITHRA